MQRRTTDSTRLELLHTKFSIFAVFGVVQTGPQRVCASCVGPHSTTACVAGYVDTPMSSEGVYAPFSSGNTPVACSPNIERERGVEACLSLGVCRWTCCTDAP